MEKLPDDVVWLVDACLPTMEHIDLLLLLVRTSPMSATQASAQLHRDLDLTTTRLEEFVRVGLAVRKLEGGERVFAYRPASVREEMAVKTLVETYNVRPVSLIRFLHERPSAPTAVQQFADAFRIGGRKRK